MAPKRKAAAVAEKRVKTFVARGEIGSDHEDAGIAMLGSPPRSTNKRKNGRNEKYEVPVDSMTEILALNQKRMELEKKNNEIFNPSTPEKQKQSESTIDVDDTDKPPTPPSQDDSPSKDSDTTVPEESSLAKAAQLMRVKATPIMTRRRVYLPEPSHLRPRNSRVCCPPEIFDDIKHLERVHQYDRPAIPQEFLVGSSAVNMWDYNTAILEREMNTHPELASDLNSGRNGLKKRSYDNMSMKMLKLEARKRAKLESEDAEPLPTEYQGDELRLYSTAIGIVENLQDIFEAKKNNIQNIQIIRQSIQLKLPLPPPEMKNIALGQIQNAARKIREQPELFANWQNRVWISQMDNHGCSFCWFECDYGICDERCWLPEEASCGYCKDCYSGDESFTFLWNELMRDKFRYGDRRHAPSMEQRRRIQEISKKNIPALKELVIRENFVQNASPFIAGNRDIPKPSGFRTPRRVASDSVAAPLQVSKLRSRGSAGPHSGIVRSASAGSALQALRAFQRENERLGCSTTTADGKLAGVNTDPQGEGDNNFKANSGNSIEIALAGAMQTEGVDSQNGAASENQRPFLAEETDSDLHNIPGQKSIKEHQQPSSTALDATSSSNSAQPLANNTLSSSNASGDLPRKDLQSSPPGEQVTSGLKLHSQPTQIAASSSNASIVTSLLPEARFDHCKLPLGSMPSPPRRPSGSQTQIGKNPLPLGDSMQPLNGASPSRTSTAPSTSFELPQSIKFYPGPTFCRANPYRQVDVKKLRICLECKREKFEIVKHRHINFTFLVDLKAEPESDPNGEWGRRDRERNCMICLDMATSKCTGCPLRLCASCETQLSQCKGEINTLLMAYDRLHIRNDAFLLRNDNYGY